jgi:hypothetical protein
MSKIQVGRFMESFRRLLDIEQNAGPADLAPEVNMVFVQENDRPEWSLHKGERIVRLCSREAGGAAAVAKKRFRNPATSGVMVTVRELGIANQSAVVFQYQVRLIAATTDLATLSGALGVPVDTRLYQGGATTALGALITSGTSVDAAADAGFVIYRGACTGSLVSPVIPIACMLAPGYALEVQTEAVGVVNICCNLLTWERGMTVPESML